MHIPESPPAILPDPLPRARWAIGPLPRVPYLPDLPAASKKALHRQAAERAFAWWQRLLLHVFAIAAFAVPVLAGIRLLPAAFRLPWAVGMVAGAVVGLVIDAALWCGFVNPRIWLCFRGILAEHGLCPRCGYDLRGVPGESAVCQECGTRVGARGRRRIEETTRIDAAAEGRRLTLLLACSFVSIVLVLWAVSRLPRHWPILLGTGIAVGILGDPVVTWDRRRLRKRRGLCPRCGCEPKGGIMCCTGCEDPSRCRPGVERQDVRTPR